MTFLDAKNQLCVLLPTFRGLCIIFWGKAPISSLGEKRRLSALGTGTVLGRSPYVKHSFFDVLVMAGPVAVLQVKLEVRRLFWARSPYGKY